MSNEYRIVLVNESSDGSNGKSPVAPTDQGGGEAKDTSDKKEKGVSFKDVKNFIVFKKLSGYVKQGIQYQIGTVALRTGNHELQARIQAGYDIASQAVGFATTVAVGAKVGGVYGAIAAAVFGIMDQMVNYAQKVQTYNMQRNLESTSIALMNVRAGGNVATTSGRRR